MWAFHTKLFATLKKWLAFKFEFLCRKIKAICLSQMRQITPTLIQSSHHQGNPCESPNNTSSECEINRWRREKEIKSVLRRTSFWQLILYLEKLIKWFPESFPASILWKLNVQVTPLIIIIIYPGAHIPSIHVHSNRVWVEGEPNNLLFYNRNSSHPPTTHFPRHQIVLAIL